MLIRFISNFRANFSSSDWLSSEINTLTIRLDWSLGTSERGFVRNIIYIGVSTFWFIVMGLGA